MKKIFVVILASIIMLTFSSVAMAAKIKGVLIVKKGSSSKIAQNTPTPGHKYVDTIVVTLPRGRTVYVRRNRSAFRALAKAMAAKIKGVLIVKKGSSSKIAQNTPTPGHKYVDTVVKIPRRVRVYLRRNRSAFRSMQKARHDSMMAAIRNIR